MQKQGEVLGEKVVMDLQANEYNIEFEKAIKALKEIREHVDGHQEKSKKRKSIDHSWISTYSGKKFNVFNPSVDMVSIEDIAHALSQICRFTGHSKEFYSVASHCVYVSYICNRENALWGLLHDGGEAYATDIASPIKNTDEFAFYRKIESKIQEVICEKFNLPKEEPEDVKYADKVLLYTEARDLMTLNKDWVFKLDPLPFKIVAHSPKEAKDLFLNRFKELTSD